MTVNNKHRKTRLLLLIFLFCCFIAPNQANAKHLKDTIADSMEQNPFYILILGDSQMSGAGWDGGYLNCILEAYPEADVLNLAVSGSRLANGEIMEQWEKFLEMKTPMPDLILLDGGGNDMMYANRIDIEEKLLPSVVKSFYSLVEEIHAESPDTHIIYTTLFPFFEWSDSEIGPPSLDVQLYFWRQMNTVANQYYYVTVLDLFSLNPFDYPCNDCFEKYFADSLHLNEAGYRKTFEYIDNILSAQYSKKVYD